eukprot:3822366-Rhodomonas_salina.1
MQRDCCVHYFDKSNIVRARGGSMVARRNAIAQQLWMSFMREHPNFRGPLTEDYFEELHGFRAGAEHGH